jgi:hypothetical protein
LPRILKLKTPTCRRAWAASGVRANCSRSKRPSSYYCSIPQQAVLPQASVETREKIPFQLGSLIKILVRVVVAYRGLGQLFVPCVLHISLMQTCVYIAAGNHLGTVLKMFSLQFNSCCNIYQNHHRAICERSSNWLISRRSMPNLLLSPRQRTSAVVNSRYYMSWRWEDDR